MEARSDAETLPAVRARIAEASRQMQAELAKARASFQQNTNRGDGAEDAVRAVLREYLPRRFEVGHGEVIDSFGGHSAETDVVIANEDHPFTFTTDKPGLFFIEGVSAAGEVKSVLTRERLIDALNESVRFKALRVANIESMAMVGGHDPNPFGEHPPWFLFAFESPMTIDAIGKTIVAFRQELPADKRMADYVAVLDRGNHVDLGDGLGELRMMAPDGSFLKGWARELTDDVLFSFLGWLNVSVPRVVRMSSILKRYLVPRGERNSR